jgi:hypothetical protein
MGFFTYAKGVVSLTAALKVVDGRSEICTPNHLEKSPANGTPSSDFVFFQFNQLVN